MKKYSVPPVIILIFILSGLALQSGCSFRAQTANSNADTGRPASVDVSVAAAEPRDVPLYFEATGSLSSDAQTDVAPLVGGKITEVNFDIGSYVNRGDVMVRLDDRDARLKIEQNEKQAQQARDAVEQARANLRQAFAKLGLSENQNFNITQVGCSNRAIFRGRFMTSGARSAIRQKRSMKPRSIWPTRITPASALRKRLCSLRSVPPKRPRSPLIRRKNLSEI